MEGPVQERKTSDRTLQHEARFRQRFSYFLSLLRIITTLAGYAVCSRDLLSV